MTRGRRPLDLLVVGGGTGGLVSALIAAGVGARVALVERHRTGGDCLWTGCVPSKALVAAAGAAHRMRTADRVGLRTVEPDIDFAAVMDHVDRARARIAPEDSPERLRRDGVEVIEGACRLTGPGRAEAAGRSLRFRAVILATGSAPRVLAVPGLRDGEMVTSDTVWALRERPERLVVVGGGPVGCELAQAFARLGSRVTLVEGADRVLGKEEPRASAVVAEALHEDGVDLRLGAHAVSVSGEGGDRRLSLDDAGPALAFDRILLAVGREPVTDGLGLDAAGVALDEGGAIVVDDTLRTTARGVFAVGDVTGRLPFTHVAAHQARIGVVNALFGLRRTADYSAVPWATFTDPEVGRVGLTEAQARERGAVTVAEFDLAHSDRAIAGGETRGFAKLVGDGRGRLLGATVVARHGGELVAEPAVRIARGDRIDSISQQVHPYPTLSEAAARAADGHLRARLSSAPVRAGAGAALWTLRAAWRVRRRLGGR